jgi:cell wall-associated NlpC family hydrolase
VRRRLTAGVLLLLALVGASALAIADNHAGAQQSAQAQLHAIETKQSSVAQGIDGLNQQVDSLIGQMSGLKTKQADLAKALVEKRAELVKANAELAQGEAHLNEVRAQLQRSLVVLRDRLVEIYKSNQPDMISIILEQSSWSDVEATSEYLDRIQNNDKTVVDRVHSLRDEVKHQVELLTEARNTVENAKQAIIDQRRELAATKRSLLAQRSQLVAARHAREAVLTRLRSQASSLSGALNGPLSGGETVPSSPGHAGLVNGEAVAPANAPQAVVDVINAANQINSLPYVWGGGHGSFDSPSGYDCSGSVSFALHGGGFLSSPLDSTGLSTWGSAGFGTWITVFANSGHAYMYVAGLRFDTGGNGGGFGPRWHSDLRDNAGFIARHPSGY